MNVGLVTRFVSYSGGGVSEVVHHLATGLANVPQTRVEVYSVATEGIPEDLSDSANPSLHTFKPLGPRVFGYTPGMSGSLQAAPLDIVHAHGFWTYSSTACRRWSHQTGKPYILSPHGTLDSWALRNSGWKKRIAAWAYERRNLENAACLHALNVSEAEAMRAYGLHNPIAVVPNGVILPATAGACDAAPWEGRIEEGKKVLLFLGRLHPQKGLPNLLRAWRKIHSAPEAKCWQLAIAGWNQGRHEQDLHILTQELGIQDTVTFIGSQFGAAKEAALRCASAFILPSLSEGMPLAVLEAWASNLPVLMTPQCNLPVGFSAGAAIQITHSEEGIETGLSQLLAMSNMELRQMGERGRTLVEQEFTWPKVARQMAELYRWVLGGGPAPSFILQA